MTLLETGSFLFASYLRFCLITVYLILVMAMKKFDCLKDREAVIPDHSNKSTRKDLGKITDYVSLKFDCPMIVINGKFHKYSSSTRCQLVE